MSLEFYRWLHIVGLLLLFCGLTALWGIKFALGSSSTSSRRIDITFAVVHGLGIFLLLLSGFGMLARLGLVQGLPSWVYAKLGIWLALGLSMYLAKRKASMGSRLVAVWIFLGATAAYFGIFKPF